MWPRDDDEDDEGADRDRRLRASPTRTGGASPTSSLPPPAEQLVKSAGCRGSAARHALAAVVGAARVLRHASAAGLAQAAALTLASAPRALRDHASRRCTNGPQTVAVTDPATAGAQGQFERPCWVNGDHRRPLRQGDSS